MHNKVLFRVIDEMRRARMTHKPFPTAHPERALAILTEEVGEVAEAVLVNSRQHKLGKLVNLRVELVQVATVAVMWLEDLQILEDQEEACRAKGEAYYGRTGGAVGVGGEGCSSSVPVCAQADGVGGQDRGSERRTYSDMEGRATKNATAPDRVGEPSDRVDLGGRGVHTPRHFGPGD